MIERALVDANTRFGFKLFGELARQQPGQNIFVSPASVFLALAMAYNGAAGETQRAMAAALELDGMALDALNRISAELLRSLQSSDSQIRLAIANALWARQGIAFAPDFISRARQFYGAEVETLDFAEPRAVATINGWVREHTGGKIERIVEQISPDALLFLINAIYFKGRWTHPFDKQRTQERIFHMAGGGQKQHPMMARSGEYHYYEGPDFQAVRLPYGDERLSMEIFLPAPRSSLEGLERELGAHSWLDWTRRFHKSEGNLVLPRFKLEYEVKLNESLTALGMASAFDPRRADFGGIGAGRLNIDEVRHKTFVEVNEEGTEAAAVTSVGMVLASFAPKRTFSMVVDRPFFCAITDNRSGALLFMGAIVDP